MVEKLDFKEAHRHVRSGDFQPSTQMHLRMAAVTVGQMTKEDAVECVKKHMRSGLERVYADKTVWKPEFDKIAEWLVDNGGKGLCLQGKCGTGKTVMANYIIPTLMNYYYRLVCSRFDATALARDPDEVMQYHVVVIDDVGQEGETVTYGQRRQAFAELVDAAEKKGKLIILTTNLTMAQLKEKYGERVVDRLLGLTRGIKFTGKSLRLKNRASRAQESRESRAQAPEEN